MSSRSWVRVPHGTHADLAQVAFGQTQAFHLGTWLERRTFHPEVPGSSPGFGICHISSVGRAQDF